jgi:hypothetical protein
MGISSARRDGPRNNTFSDSRQKWRASACKLRHNRSAGEQILVASKRSFAADGFGSESTHSRSAMAPTGPTRPKPLGNDDMLIAHKLPPASVKMQVYGIKKKLQ